MKFLDIELLETILLSISWILKSPRYRYIIFYEIRYIIFYEIQ